MEMPPKACGIRSEMSRFGKGKYTNTSKTGSNYVFA